MKLKKLVSLLLVSVLMVSLTGCVGNLYKNAGTIDGEEITSGMYLMAQLSAFNEAQSLVKDSEKNVFKQKVEDENATTWIRNRTEDTLLRHVAIQRIAAEREIFLSDQNKTQIEESMTYWDMAGDYYTENGIAKTTLEKFMVNEALSDQLFFELYGADGEFATPDKQLMEEYAEKFAHVRFISIPINSLDEEKEVDSDKLNAHVESMLADLKGGKTLEDVATKSLAGAYEILGREFDEATAVGNISNSFINYEPKDFETYSEEFLKTLREQKIGEFGMYEMSSTILLYEKVTVFENEEAFDAKRDEVLTALRKDAFDEYLKEIYSAYSVNWHFGARWFLRPSKLG